MNIKQTIPLVFLGSIIVASNVFAKSIQQLQEDILQYVKQSEAVLPDNQNSRTEIKVGTLDNRIQLKPCERYQFARINTNNNQSKFTIKVSCSSESWKLHVPVSVERFIKVVSIQSPIKRGNTIQELDVILTERNVNKLTQGYYINSADVIGKVAKRSLNQGTVINPKWIEAPILIQRGDRISIIAKTLGLTVKSYGVAQADGRIDDVIAVKNLSSQRTVFAKIKDHNTVEVEL